MTDREKLIELVCEAVQTDACVGFCNHPHCGKVQTIADHLIANNTVIQKQGKWEVNIDEDDCEYARCTVCGEEFYDGDNDTIDRFPNYCNECGARMDVD